MPRLYSQCGPMSRKIPGLRGEVLAPGDASHGVDKAIMFVSRPAAGRDARRVVPWQDNRHTSGCIPQVSSASPDLHGESE
jgi:hypothetical protein